MLFMASVLQHSFSEIITSHSSRIGQSCQGGWSIIFSNFFLNLLPLSLPIIVVTIIWQFTQIWNDFLFGVSFSEAGTQPITVALNNIVNSTTGVKEYNVDMAAAIIAALPTLAIYVIAGKYFIRGLTAGSVKG